MSKQPGFSLVELSIVLVILGLLVGGVLSGQALIRAAELRSINTQFQNYMAATQTFRDKYFALPGDMTNATSFWGSQGGTGANLACSTATGTGTQTCNGNGDGRVSGTTTIENFHFWQQLANAGLIEGSYAGKYTGAGWGGSNATNLPKGKIGTTLWFVDWYYGTGDGVCRSTDADYGFFYGNYQNYMELGGMMDPSDPGQPFLKPEEVWNIDTKMDDGMPATGKVVVRGYAAGGCNNAADRSVLTATYNLSNSAQACAIIFRQLF